MKRRLFTAMKASKITSFLAAMVCQGAIPPGSMREAGEESRPEKTGGNADDSLISRKVEDVLSKDENHAYASVQVETHQGIVELHGGVATPGQKRHAGELAHTVNGVRKVQNRITVKDLFRYYASHLFDGLHKTH